MKKMQKSTAIEEKKLSGAEKAAILILVVNEEHAAELFSRLDLDEVKEIFANHVAARACRQRNCGGRDRGVRRADYALWWRIRFVRSHRETAGTFP